MANIPSISPGSTPKCYGFLVGLSLERGDLAYSEENPGKMFARFELSGASSTYVVPDWELLAMLAEHLCGSARARAQDGDYEFEKLWINRVGKKWAVRRAAS